jgi:AI-2 transport protein TqsA
MALVQTGSLGFMAIIAAVIMLIQTAVFNFMEPLLIGKRLDLNPIAILLSVLIWGYLWGIVGMLLAVPLTAIMKIALTNSQNQNVRFIVDLMNHD